MATPLMDDTPKARIFIEKIGEKEYELREERLHVTDEVALWAGNPRLLPYLAEAPGGEAEGGFKSEEELAQCLARTNGYAPLLRSMEDIGQMEAIYAWKGDSQPKFLVIEGATRVTIFRELLRKHTGRPDEARFRYITAKILPANFGPAERAVLLAKIHVRGSGVREWHRYIQARFVHETVEGKDGQKPLMTVRELARHMGKSDSWVSRLKEAYKFARKFVEHVDAPDSEKLASQHFSTLEEIAKCSGIGPKLKDYENSQYDQIRSEVFDMVRSEVFKEYRDARFMKDFADDPEKWAILKQGEKDSAHKLAIDLKAGTSSLRARVEALSGQIERAFERDSEALNEDDLESLRKAVRTVESFVNPGVQSFRLELLALTRAIAGASLLDIKALQENDVAQLDEALDDFRTRLAKHKAW